MKRKVWLVGKDEKRKSWLRKGQLCGREDTEDPVSHKGREGEGGREGGKERGGRREGRREGRRGRKRD